MNSAPLARVLIVDDDSAAMRALRDTLRDHGYETAGFISGEEALVALRKTQFDLLLSDLVMPHMDGVELLTAALAIDSQLVGILMTGKGTIETAVAAMQAGALDYVLKPIKLSALLPVLARAAGVQRLRLENMNLRNTVAVHEMNQAIAYTLDPNVLLDKIVDAAMAQFEADEVSVMLPTDDGYSLTVAAVRGERRESLLGTRMPVGEGIAGWVADHCEPLVLEGQVNDPRWLPQHPRSDIQSSLSMPMVARNKLVGVLSVNCIRRRRTFTPGEIKLLSIFTNAAAAGLEAARLYDAQHKSDARYREVLDMAADGIISIDEEQRIVVFNAGAEDVFGYQPEEVIGRSLDILLPPDAIARHRRHVQEFERGPDTSRVMMGRDRLFGRRRDGTLFNAEVGISKRSEKSGTLYTAVVRDVTLRIQQEDKIARLTRIHEVLSGINSTIVRVRERDELFYEACRIAVVHGKFRLAWIGTFDATTGIVTQCAKAGHDEGYLAKINLTSRADAPRSCPLVVDALTLRLPMICNDIVTDERTLWWRDEALKRGYRAIAVFPLMIMQEAVGIFALYALESGFFDEEEMILLKEMSGDVAFALDHLAKSEQIDYLAYYDVLTGLPNRTLFNDRLQQRVSGARRDQQVFAVVIIDLDRFRNINETLGRQIGDDLLQQVAQRLKLATDETHILARIGPDQFALATRRSEDAGDVARLHEQILLRVLGLPFELGGNALRLAAHAGIAVYPADGVDSDSLFRNAEAALRDAKRSGLQARFYAPQMNAMVAETLLLESKMREALVRQQFVLHYQPKMDVLTGTVSGLEALIRWNDPETGLVPPGKFIPLLEETGIILDVGYWAINKALEDFRWWQRLGRKAPRVAVNVSPIQLRQGGFVDIVRNAVGGSIAGSHGLDLEITESLIIEDIESNIAKLHAISDMGVNVHIDDFGTGYSSLRYLAKLPVTALKIDRSFIMAMGSSPESMTIVSTILSLAHTLNLKVIAEGVETEEQLNSLKLLNCDVVQGYLFSKPLPADETEAFFTSAGVK